QEPRFIMVWIPTSTQVAGKAVFFPHQSVPIPRCVHFEQKITPSLPVAIAATKGSTTIGLILYPKEVMPLIALTEPDQWQSCQSTICQKGHVARMQKAGNLCKETIHDLPLALLPLLALRHNFPCQ